MSILLNAEWLKDNLLDSNIVVLDIRSPREYSSAHIPNSKLVPYDKILDFNADSSYFDIAPKEKIEELLSILGVKNDSVLVICGDRGGTTASRLFWSLTYYGLKVKYLDLSFSKWMSLGYPVTDKVEAINNTDFVITQSKLDFKVDHEYVLSKLDDSGSILLDTRSPDEFNGIIAAGPKSGRIPNSKNFPWELAVGDDGYIFKTIENLSNLFEKFGITKDKEIICYCQVGERASHTFVALQLCEYNNVKIYDRSFADWSTRDNLPIEN